MRNKRAERRKNEDAEAEAEAAAEAEATKPSILQHPPSRQYININIKSRHQYININIPERKQSKETREIFQLSRFLILIRIFNKNFNNTFNKNFNKNRK